MSGTAPDGRTGPGGYVALFEVSFRHAFYNAAGGYCPDLQASPTASTAQMMSQLGVMMRRQSAGFGLYAPSSRVEAIARFVASQYTAGAVGAGYWTRLSFVLKSANSDFIGVTRLPLSVSPMAQMLYVSNLQVTSGAHGLGLGSKPVLGREALHDLTAGRLRVAAPSPQLVTDLSGAVVRTVQPKAGVADISFSGLPYGCYRIAGAGAAQPTPPARTVVYAPTAPTGLCLMDLMLAAPTADAEHPQAFPLPHPASASPASSTPVELTLAFAARETRWRYFVVSQKPHAVLADDLTISGPAAIFTRSAEVLPTGAPAAVFTASKALPLRQLSPYAFGLSGHRRSAGGVRDLIRVERLPSAAAAPVWPEPSGRSSLTALSEIYVYV